MGVCFHSAIRSIVYVRQHVLFPSVSWFYLRAGAANLDVIQEVEYVKQEAKIVYLLECLQKTAPPVCIFCEKKQVSKFPTVEKKILFIFGRILHLSTP